MNRSAIGRLGDIPNEEFRERLHKLADWVADYREHIAERPIAPNDKPGAVLTQLDQAPPEGGAALDEIFSDIERVIVPGVAHWAHPQFMSYFGCTTTSPGILAEMITAALNVIQQLHFGLRRYELREPVCVFNGNSETGL